jgi:protein gp37
MTGIKKSIGWCTHTNNAITGCLGPHGKTCHYCWGLIFRKRLAGVPGMIQFALREANIDINSPAFSRQKLAQLGTQLSRARKRRRIFFSSMGDLGYEGMYYHVKDGKKTNTQIGSHVVRKYASELFAENPCHTFLILSKQPEGLADTSWPDNTHVGVSASTPEELGERLPVLLDDVDAKLKWVSVEPLLDHGFNRLLDEVGTLDWVVVGAQSGKGVPPPKVSEAKRIVSVCNSRNIACYVKHNMRQYDPAWFWPTDLPEVPQ